MSWRVFLNLTAATIALSACTMQRSATADLRAFQFFHCEARGLHAVQFQGVFQCVSKE